MIPDSIQTNRNNFQKASYDRHYIIMQCNKNGVIIFWIKKCFSFMPFSNKNVVLTRQNQAIMSEMGKYIALHTVYLNNKFGHEAS